ncbi:RNA-directed DNA polymerase, eukaryota, reverse transcriptase zinc-binding domain protein [Tanacetum coccineum]
MARGKGGITGRGLLSYARPRTADESLTDPTFNGDMPRGRGGITRRVGLSYAPHAQRMRFLMIRLLMVICREEGEGTQEMEVSHMFLKEQGMRLLVIQLPMQAENKKQLSVVNGFHGLDYSGVAFLISRLITENEFLASGVAFVSPNQSAFIEGRQILDGCLIANEIIRMTYLEKLKLLLFNFEKAFDSVNWNFLLDVMRQMGFGSKWRKWIASCLSSASISVLINGSPSNEFKMERGLRQGDPLSPSYFSWWSKVSRFNAKNLTHILKCFELGSGLKVNFSKSKLFGIGIPSNEVEAMASSLGCAHDVLPCLYLGLPVGKRMGLCDGGNEVINRCRNRLSSWKAKSLSVGGRLTLIKSILEDSHGICWVKWKSILLDHKFGGLGVGCLHSKNLGLLGKRKWRFLTEENALWRIVIKDFYGVDGGFGSSVNSNATGGIWQDIIKDVKLIENIDISFKYSFTRKISSGADTMFWKDSWCGDGTRLMDKFPRLYALESNKDCMVRDRWCSVNGVRGGRWSWHFAPRRRANDDLSSLVSLIGNLSLSEEGLDKWIWSKDPSGQFKVSSLSKSIQILSLSNHALGDHFWWNSWIPWKVNVCIWRASIDRLATRPNLLSCGVDISSTACPFCDCNVKDIEHCLIKCPKVLPGLEKGLVLVESRVSYFLPFLFHHRHCSEKN